MLVITDMESLRADHEENERALAKMHEEWIRLGLYELAERCVAKLLRKQGKSKGKK